MLSLMISSKIALALVMRGRGCLRLTHVSFIEDSHRGGVQTPRKIPARAAGPGLDHRKKGTKGVDDERLVVLGVVVDGGDSAIAELVVLGRGLAVELDVSR